VVPEFEATVRQATSRDVAVSYDAAHDSWTDFSDLEFTGD